MSLKRFAFWAILALIPLLLLEAMSYAWYRALPVYFSLEPRFMETATPEGFQEYVSSASFDPKLGWNLPEAPTTRVTTNCLGTPVEYHYRARMRVGLGPSEGENLVALFGDSYTHGD
jgi:hypothetical protein